MSDRPVAPYRCYLGWDASQMRAWSVAAFSLRRSASVSLDVHRLAMPTVQAAGLYRRPTQLTDTGYWDVISAAPMATGHAIARFLVPHLCGYQGWALFTDGDILVRKDIAALFALADPRYAVQVVQHTHVPTEDVKMTGETQTRYARKNWSSVMLWYCGHPANQALTVDLINTVPGRDLHRFCWLEDAMIGALPPEWNLLIGSETHPDPSLVHFTDGLPYMDGYSDCPYAGEWFRTSRAAGYRFPEKVPA